MKKKYINTLAALALLAALWSAMTYWEKRQSSKPTQSESTPEEKVFPVEISHIRAFTLKLREGEPVTGRREDKDWAIIAPRRLPADESAISAFLNSLTSARVDQVVDPKPANLNDFGLDSPYATLEVSTDTKPEKLTLLLGDETPTRGGVYAQLGGNPRVITLASYMRSSLGKSLFDLRDRRAVTLDVDHLQRIEAESKGKRWTLVKNPEGIWDLVLPPPVRADRFTVDSLVDRLRNLSMQSILAEDKKSRGKYSFEKPELRVVLTGPAGSQTLVLGKKEDDRYVTMNAALEPIFTLNSDFLTQFQKVPSDLRDKNLFSFSPFDAKRVEVETPSGQRVFEQQKDKWKQTAPSAKDLAADKLENLLNRLRDLRADSFPTGQVTDLARFGLTKPAYRIKVEFGEKNQTEIVELAKVGGHVYGRRSTDAVACEVPRTNFEDVEKALKDL